MYSRNTDRGGRRIKLPPGYDGNAFRHDTGEIRRLAEEPEMKIHSPAESGGHTETVEELSDDTIGVGQQKSSSTGSRKQQVLTGSWREIPEPEDTGVADISETESAVGNEEDAAPIRVCAVNANGGIGAGKGNGSLLEGLFGSLGSEDWLLFLVILLLAADGSDAWDLILLLGLLLAVK